MAKCKTLQRESISICIGDLNKKIDIKARVLTPSSTGSIDVSEVFTTVATVWAMVSTMPTRGERVFDDTNVSPAGVNTLTTHTFYIRYRSGITQENWIEYNDKHYDILEVWNLNEDSTFLQLQCLARGSTSYDINDA